MEVIKEAQNSYVEFVTLIHTALHIKVFEYFCKALTLDMTGETKGFVLYKLKEISSI